MTHFDISLYYLFVIGQINQFKEENQVNRFINDLFFLLRFSKKVNYWILYLRTEWVFEIFTWFGLEHRVHFLFICTLNTWILKIQGDYLGFKIVSILHFKTDNSNNVHESYIT